MSDLEVRRADEADREPVLALLSASLGWGSGQDFQRYFYWKHEDNPFGVSPSWVAVDGDRVVGFRTFMRWEFLGIDGRVQRAVRAVDTATDPDYRGRGIFRRLTLQAVADMTVDGVSFVFNTPNDQSRPGYLKMGWTVAGRVPIAVRPAGVASIRRMSRVPADRWSVATNVGESAPSVMADAEVAEALIPLARRGPLATKLTSDVLRWRVAFPLLEYRFFPLSADTAEGGLVFRLTRRGAGLSAVVIESFLPRARDGFPLITRLLRETQADYALAGAHSGVGGLLPAPRQGPILTTRPLAGPAPTAKELALTLSDAELF